MLSSNLINGTSLFSNVGIAEFYLKSLGINIVVANEIDEKRAKIYNHFYPDTHMVIGDIFKKEIFDEVIDRSIRFNSNFLIATPPCQGMSIAGKRDYLDERNSLVTAVFDYIKKVKPEYAIIENVEQQLRTNIVYNERKDTILNHFYNLFKDEYFFNENMIINSKDYSVPQNRKRAIILMCKKAQWNFPKEDEKIVTVQDTIGHLPALEPFVKEEFSGNNRDYWKFNKYHYPAIHPKRQIEAMSHTPTGESAFNNEIYFPKKIDGTPVKGYNTTYKRMKWNSVAPTITTANGSLSSQCNVHPGNHIDNDLYDNPRVLSLYEIMLLMTIPEDVTFPKNYNENLIRHVIGEGIPPLLVKKLIENMPR